MASALLAARDNEGQLLPDSLVLGTIGQMIVVGMIAPGVFIGCMMLHLATHPELQEELRNEPALIPAAIEEYLRLFTPYHGFARTSRRDVEIGGRLIKKDEPIALVYASANRDESVFPDPDEFILNRPNIKSHIAFGMGPHQCAGMPLARLMLRVSLEELLARARITGLAGEIVMTGWPEWGTLIAPVRAREIGVSENQSPLTQSSSVAGCLAWRTKKSNLGGAHRLCRVRTVCGRCTRSIQFRPCRITLFCARRS